MEIVSVSVYFKVLSLDKVSSRQIWNIEQKKNREKEKVGGRPVKLYEKKGDRDLEREIKNKGNIFLLEEQHENFVAAVWRAVCFKINFFIGYKFLISFADRIYRPVIDQLKYCYIVLIFYQRRKIDQPAYHQSVRSISCP